MQYTISDIPPNKNIAPPKIKTSTKKYQLIAIFYEMRLATEANEMLAMAETCEAEDFNDADFFMRISSNNYNNLWQSHNILYMIV